MRERPVVLIGARQAAIRRLAARALQPSEFQVHLGDGRDDVIERAADLQPDVILVDWGPAMGEELRELRGVGSHRVLLLDIHASPMRAVAGLDGGADDYVGVPFHAAELASRVRAVARRDAVRVAGGRRTLGPATVDLGSRSVRLATGTRTLTRQEWSILCLLLEHPDRVLSHEELLSAAYGPASRDESDRLAVVIRTLRRKLGIDPWDEGPIRTVRGRGYAYDPDDRIPRNPRPAPDAWA